jgi:hypothetical protein
LSKFSILQHIDTRNIVVNIYLILFLFIILQIVFLKINCKHIWWFMPVIPATWDLEIGGPQFKASTGKNLKISEIVALKVSRVW